MLDDALTPDVSKTYFIRKGLPYAAGATLVANGTFYILGILSWQVFVTSLLTSLLISLLLFFFFKEWLDLFRVGVEKLYEAKFRQFSIEAKNEAGTASQSLEESEPASELTLKLEQMQSSKAELSREMEALNEELKKAKKEAIFYREKHEELKEEIQSSQSRIKEQSNHKENLLLEYQQTISQQREVISQKQETISRLENKVRDLTFEVKTLLEIDTTTKSKTEALHPAVNLFEKEDSGEEVQKIYQELPGGFEKEVQSFFDASIFLKRCLELAQKMPGASHLSEGGESRLMRFSVDNFQIDLRRLFDGFRNENCCLIVVYSKVEEKLLFVNNHVRQILGWSPEKFVSGFSEIVREGLLEWKRSLQTLDTEEEAQGRLVVKNKTGENVLLHSCLGEVKSGIFKGSVIGILFEDKS